MRIKFITIVTRSTEKIQVYSIGSKLSGNTLLKIEYLNLHMTTYSRAKVYFQTDFIDGIQENI